MWWFSTAVDSVVLGSSNSVALSTYYLISCTVAVAVVLLGSRLASNQLLTNRAKLLAREGVVDHHGHIISSTRSLSRVMPLYHRETQDITLIEKLDAVELVAR